MIAIVDYGVGNVKAIANMLQRLGGDAVISSCAGDVLEADRIILPGVGSFDGAMASLADRGYVSALEEAVLRRRTPILGICLGMQLMTRGSEEGDLPGFGWIDARAVRFRFADACGHLKTPHMGWNSVTVQKDIALFAPVARPPRFYFAHSYHVLCDRDEDVVSVTPYGLDFVSSIQRDNIAGVQFHPEKSHRYGMEFLRSFANA